MNKLQGNGTTFSTSGKRWFPFRGNAKVAARNAKLRRAIAAGLIKPLTKAELRAEAERCVAAKPQ